MVDMFDEDPQTSRSRRKVCGTSAKTTAMSLFGSAPRLADSIHLASGLLLHIEVGNFRKSFFFLRITLLHSVFSLFIGHVWVKPLFISSLGK